MTTLEEQAKWHDEQAKQCEKNALAAARQLGTRYPAHRESIADAARHRASAAVCRELEKHRLVDDESPPHPCPDFALRANYRERARRLRKESDTKLSEIPHA